MRKILRFLKRKGYIVNILTLLILLDNISYAALDIQMYMMYESLIIRVLIGILGMVIVTYIVYLVSVEAENLKYNLIQRKQLKTIKALDKATESNEDLKLLDIGKVDNEIQFDTIDFQYRLRKNNEQNTTRIETVNLEEYNKQIKEMNRQLEGITLQSTPFSVGKYDSILNTFNNIPEVQNIIEEEHKKEQRVRDIIAISKLNELQTYTNNSFKESNWYKEKKKEIDNLEKETIEESLELLNRPKKRGRKKIVQASSIYNNDEIKNAKVVINSKEEVNSSDLSVFSNVIIDNLDVKKKKIRKKISLTGREKKLVLDELFGLQNEVFNNIIDVNSKLEEETKVLETSKPRIELLKEKELIEVGTQNSIDLENKKVEFEFNTTNNEKIKVFEVKDYVKSKKAPSKYKYDLFTMIKTYSEEEEKAKEERRKKALESKKELARKQRMKKVLELQLLKLKLEKELSNKKDNEVKENEEDINGLEFNIIKKEFKNKKNEKTEKKALSKKIVLAEMI